MIQYVLHFSYKNFLNAGNTHVLLFIIIVKKRQKATGSLYCGSVVFFGNNTD